MARSKPVIGIRDLIPKEAVKIKPITATGSLDGVVTFKFTSLPVSQILNKFETAINRASGRVAVDLKAALDEAMMSPYWGGQDIFDTGELLASGTVSVTDSGVTIAYSAPYAAFVHYGGYINPYGNATSRVYLPPRPWVESVLFGGAGIQPFDFVSYYTQEIAKEFNG